MIAAKQVKIQPFFRLEKDGPVKNRQIEVDEEQTFPKNRDFHRNPLHMRVPILSTPVYIAMIEIFTFDFFRR